MSKGNARLLVGCTVLLFASISTTMGGNSHRGQLLFVSCSACHNSDENATGPSLTGVLGRKAASIVNFHYSTKLTQSGIVWTPEALKKFIADPQGLIPGNRMAFAGVADATDVDDIVAYLEMLK
jgi:cytochrome c